MNVIGLTGSDRRASKTQFRRAPLALMIATLAVAGTAHAQNRSVEELRAENARLKQQLEENQRQLDQAAAQATEVAAEKPKAETDTKLGKVVVRSRSQRDRQQDVPQAVSVVTGAELDRELSLDLSSITRRSAGIQFNQNNTRGASLSIRGLGKRSFTETQDPSVGLTVDGVSYALTQLGNFDFYDVETVEVLRGPRGVEGGKGGSAGVVNITTKRPSFEKASDFQLVYGQRDSVLAKANFTGPLIDDVLAWRGSFIADRGRGFYESEYDDNYTFYNRNRLSGRTQLLFTPTPEFTARLSADLEPKAPQVENGLTFRHDQPYLYANGSLTDASGTTARSKLAGFTDDRNRSYPGRALLNNRTYSGNGDIHDVYDYEDYVSRRLLQNQNQGQTVTNKGVSADLSYSFDAGTLSSITAWRRYSFDAHNDEGTPFDISRNGGGGVDYKQYSQEFRFDGVAGKVDYTTGIYLLKTEDNIASKTGWGSDGGAWFATNAQYGLLERDAGVNRGAGIALLNDSLNDAYTYQSTLVDTDSGALYGKFTWHLTDKFNLDGGLRVTYEDRATRDTKILSASGSGAGLNPDSVRGVNLGGFNSDASGTLGTNTAAQLALANSVAQRYYSVDYAALTSQQRNQIAAAKAIRAGQIGQLSNGVKSSYYDVLYTGLLSPSYQIDPDNTVYFSYQYGEKSGSALNVNFSNANVTKEKTNAFEVGWKSFLLDRTLSISTDIYYMDIRDYQSAVRVVDEFTTATNIANGQVNPIAYVTAQGNIDEARVQGWEFDAFYSGIPFTTVRFSGAYTDAKFITFENAAFPEEDAYLSTAAKPYTDQNGKGIPGVSRWTGNIGVEYRHPIFDNRSFHASFNTSFNSRYNNITDTNTSNSDFGWVGGGSRTDAAIGLTFANDIDVSVIGRNIFDDRKHETGWTSYTPYAYPRWVGISVSGKL